jgi:16S rRNA processing protein RimM
MKPKLFTVGKIVNTHGIRGELKILPQTDFPDVRFEPGSVLTFLNPENGATLEATVQSARENKNVYIVKFEQFDNINEVEKYKGWVLKVTEDQLVDLSEDEYYYHEIVGCRVITDEGLELGTISEILAPGANHVWVVERPKGQGKPVLIPVIDDVILKVDVAEKTVHIHLMEGLLD